MGQPKLILFVKFKSGLSMEEIKQVSESRVDQFRAIPGLTQKFYVQDANTGEVGGIYLWDSPESFEAYRDSELRATIAEAYRVEGEPCVEVLRILDVLRD